MVIYSLKQGFLNLINIQIPYKKYSQIPIFFLNFVVTHFIYSSISYIHPFTKYLLSA